MSIHYKNYILTDKDEYLTIPVISDSDNKEAYYFIVFGEESKKRYGVDYKKIEHIDFLNFVQKPEYRSLKLCQGFKVPLCFFRDWENKIQEVNVKNAYIEYIDLGGSTGKMIYGDEKLRNKNYFCVDELKKEKYEISYKVYFKLQNIIKEKKHLDKRELM